MLNIDDQISSLKYSALTKNCYEIYRANLIPRLIIRYVIHIALNLTAVNKTASNLLMKIPRAFQPAVIQSPLEGSGREAVENLPTRPL